MCGACQRPQRACLCRWVTPVAHTTRVLILQHPLEVHHAKNTARLLHLSLGGSQLLVGEAFDAPTLQTALQGPATNVLLYPRSATASTLDAGAVERAPQAQAEAAAFDASTHPPGQPLRLVVLDGTWRKSRKMLHLNPLLQSLPRLSLDGVHASRYLIRKAHKPGQLSTLEATCAALAQLEGDDTRFEPLLRASDGFVAHRQGFVGS